MVSEELPQRVDIIVDYATVLEPSLTRNIRLTRMVPTALPLVINVEDFFRGTRYVVLYVNTSLALLPFYRLFTRFTLSSTTHQHVRVQSTELRSTSDHETVLINKGLPSHPGTVVSPKYL